MADHTSGGSSDTTEQETLALSELVRDTAAERFDTEGYDIVGLEWVAAGLRIEAKPPAESEGANIWQAANEADRRLLGGEYE